MTEFVSIVDVLDLTDLTQIRNSPGVLEDVTELSDCHVSPSVNNTKEMKKFVVCVFV